MSEDYRIKARAIARKHGIDPGIFQRLVKQESGGNAKAVSPKGAKGLTQLMPGTAAELGVDPNDPDQALEGGARYLAAQLKRFGGDYEKALAAYNAGPGNVEKYGGVPPFPETQRYVKTILAGRPRKTTTADSEDVEHLEAAAFLNGEPGGQGLPPLETLMGFLDGKIDAPDFLAEKAAADAEEAAMQVSAEEAEAPASPHTALPSRRSRSVTDLGHRVDSLVRRMGAQPGSGVRSDEENAAVGGAQDSDHLDRPDRWARDIPESDLRKQEAIARKIAKELGARFEMGTISNSVVKIGRKSYRVQIIAGTPDHDDHVHVGIRAA